jgi:rRNA maturation endonuclease Nob1
MTDHPYAVGNTLTPGQVAEDDPMSEKERCPNCDELVELTPENTCTKCGKEVR